MSIYTPNWDKIINPLGSTTTTFGGSWANLISDYHNGVNIVLLDPTKKPKIGTPTLYKFETLRLLDVDESHEVVFSVDDVDTGPTRKIKVRRMNTPFEEDYMLFEGSPAAILNKDIDSDLNNITNIVNSDIKADAGITDNKLAQITDKAKLNSNIVYTDQANTFGVFSQFFKSSTLKIQNPTETFNYTFVASGITGASKLITLPLLLSDDTFVFQNHIQPLVGKTLLDSVTGNQIGVNLPYTFTIYLEGSNIIVKANSTGHKQVFPNTDLADAIEWAANNATTYITGEDARFGGSAFLKAGAYNWITEADTNYITSTRHGFVIVGEGYGTTINMGPASGTLAQGLKVGMMGFQIKNCRINMNANIQRAIKLEGGGDGGPIRHDFPLIENVLIQGPNGNDGHLASSAGAPVTVGGIGQRGIDTDGSVNAVYFGTINQCKFISLDYGIRIFGGGGITSMHMNNIIGNCCNEVIYISGGQNSVNQLWAQGSTLVGKYGVHVASGGHNQINMVISELHKTDNGLTAIHDGGTGNPEESAAVKLDAGVGNTQIGLVNNGYRSQSSFWHAVKDDSGLSNELNSNHYSGNFVHNGLGYFKLSGGIMSLGPTFLSVRNGRLLIGDVNNSINYVVKTSTLSGAAKEILLPVLLNNDEFVFKNHIVTLAGKTLTAPVLNDPIINKNTFNIGLPTLTVADDFVLVDFPVEIFAKTISALQNTIVDIGNSSIASHTSTKITITNKAQLPSTAVYTDQTNTWGAFSQFFSNNTLKILTGGAGTLTIGATSIGTSAIATIPALTSGDTFLFASHVATMFNKTYDAEGTGNVLTNIKDSNIKAGAAIAVSKLANGTANQHLVTNAAGTTTVWRAKTPFLAAVSPPSRKNTVGVADTWVDAVSVDTASAIASTSVATFTLNTTGADQYVVEMTFRKTPSVGTVDLRLVNDANGTDVLHTFTGVTDGRQTSTIAALPAWCLGANEGLKTLRVQVRSTTSTDDVRIGQFSIRLV